MTAAWDIANQDLPSSFNANNMRLQGNCSSQQQVVSMCTVLRLIAFRLYLLFETLARIQRLAQRQPSTVESVRWKENAIESGFVDI